MPPLRLVREGEVERHQTMRQVFVTDASEYHLLGSRCIGVFNIACQTWEDNHLAIHAELLGGLSVNRAGAWQSHTPTPVLGDKLVFSGDVVTSPLRQVRRTSGAAQASLPHFAKAA